MKYLVSAIAILALASCATDQGTATPGYYKPAAASDPDARFGVLLETPMVDVSTAAAAEVLVHAVIDTAVAIDRNSGK